jgi:hypothetical protein
MLRQTGWELADVADIIAPTEVLRLAAGRMRPKEFARGNAMTASSSTRTILNLGMASALAMFLGGCGSMSLPSFSSGPSAPPEPAVAPDMPASIRPEEIAGRWGLASYQNPNDRARTEKAAQGQCKQPYVITVGPTGGVVMHLADEATPQELRLKGSPSGKNYIGPPGPVPGDRDREILSFDGRILVTRFVDKDAATRYGNMVYVRCAPRA